MKIYGHCEEIMRLLEERRARVFFRYNNLILFICKWIYEINLELINYIGNILGGDNGKIQTIRLYNCSPVDHVGDDDSHFRSLGVIRRCRFNIRGWFYFLTPTVFSCQMWGR